MACEVCQHCDTSFEPGESAVQVSDGLSYHRRCHKCYVCGESDLRNAETFHGVIFCAGCSQRIFQGCSTARQAKTLKSKRRSNGPRQRRRRRNGDRVLAMTINTEDSESRSSRSNENKRKLHNRGVPSTAVEMLSDNGLKKNSAERGTITDVTQELLQRAKDRQVARTIVTTHTHNTKPRKKRKTHKRKHDKHECSDLRIAELGASVEIAHMALRNQSERPVIIKSETHLNHSRSPALSIMNQESDIYEDSDSKWKDSLYSTEGELDSIWDPMRPLVQCKYRCWTQRTFTSIVKIPLKWFKRNIIDRSSQISIMSSETHARSLMKKLRLLFNEDFTEHKRNGLKKLFSTINRKNTPGKLGWLHVNKGKNSENERSNESTEHHNRCKHFANSQSYRCMREQAMRLAGPTNSELAILRAKILKVMSPGNIKRIVNYNKKYGTIVSAQAYRRE